MDEDLKTLAKIKQHLLDARSGWVPMFYTNAGAIPSDAALVEELGLTKPDMFELTRWLVTELNIERTNHRKLADDMHDFSVLEVADFVSDHGLISHTGGYSE